MKCAKTVQMFALFAGVICVAACSDDGDPGCLEGQRRCASDVVEVCSGGSWTDLEACQSPEVCEDGDCQLPCVPDCTGRICGTDGCGGSCGDCTAPQVCTTSGQCEDPPEDCGNGVCDAGEDCVNCPADCACVQCDPSSPAGLMDCVDHNRYVADLTYVSGERTPGSTHWQEVQTYCSDELEAAGFTVSLQSYGSGVNVIGELTGTTAPDELVVLMAHYDHIPGCSGADDNASGVAAVIEAARALANASYGRTLQVVCDDEEETGRIGSFEFARRANDNGDRIAAAFAVDAVAYADDTPDSQTIPIELETLFPALYAEMQANQFRADFIYVGHDDLASEAGISFEGFFEGMGRPAARVEWIGDAKFEAGNLRADQASFWAYAYPSLLINDTSGLRSPYYHCASGDDAISTLDLEFAVDVTRALVGATATVLDSTTPVPARPTPVTCAQMCSGAPMMTLPQMTCIADLLTFVGAPISTTPECADIATVPECIACTGALGLLDGDCAILSYWCAP